jgi:hypothetical protein
MPPIVQVSIQSQLLCWSFSFLFWVGVLNRLLQTGGLKKGCYALHWVVAHCFPSDMHNVLSFGYFVPVVTGAFHFLC